MAGGAGFVGDISASVASSAASKSTVAAENQFEIGRLTFGAKQDNTTLFIVGGLVLVAGYFLLKGK